MVSVTVEIIRLLNFLRPPSYLQYQKAGFQKTCDLSVRGIRIRVVGSQLQNCEVSSKSSGRTETDSPQSLGEWVVFGGGGIRDVKLLEGKFFSNFFLAKLGREDGEARPGFVK